MSKPRELLMEPVILKVVVARQSLVCSPRGYGLRQGTQGVINSYAQLLLAGFTEDLDGVRYGVPGEPVRALRRVRR